MKSINILSRLMIVAALFTLSVNTGCKKNTTEPANPGSTDNYTQAAADAEEADFIGTDAENSADVAMNGGASNLRLGDDGSNEFLSTCANVTRDTVNHILTVDFGTTNCLCKDGRYRRGKIQVTWTGGGYWTAGSVKTLTFNGYYVNDNHVEGTRTVTNNGLNSNNNLNWTISAVGMRITRPTGKFHEWNTTRNREIIAGANTFTIWDDVYSITGSATGINSNGDTCSITITSPVIRALGCHWIQQGTLDITRSSKPDLTVDFGNGNCDNQATVTRNGQTITITLH
jgi:hypothetical protein